MKASHRALATILGLTGAMVAASCVPAPDSTPAPEETVAAEPEPVAKTPVAPAPVTLPAVQSDGDWLDQPQTVGAWRGFSDQAAFVEREANGRIAPSVPLFMIDCIGSEITLSARTTQTGQAPITIRTETTDRTLAAQVRVGPDAGPRFTIATLQARDPLLDAMALTRGRFAVETKGMPHLYLPAWAEVTRVIENCR